MKRHNRKRKLLKRKGLPRQPKEKKKEAEPSTLLRLNPQATRATGRPGEVRAVGATTPPTPTTPNAASSSLVVSANYYETVVKSRGQRLD